MNEAIKIKTLKTSCGPKAVVSSAVCMKVGEVTVQCAGEGDDFKIFDNSFSNVFE